MSTPSRSPTLAEILKEAVRSGLWSAHVSMPGIIQSFNSAQNVVDVQPALANVYTREDDFEVLEQLPVVTSVPVVFPGAGGFRMTFPISVGDPCLLVFADKSIDKWYQEGGIIDPIDLRNHDLSDAICIPGLRTAQTNWTSSNPLAMTLGNDGGLQITISATEIDLGGDTDQAIKGTTFLTALNTWMAAVATAFGTLGYAPFAAVQTSWLGLQATLLSALVKLS